MKNYQILIVLSIIFLSVSGHTTPILSGERAFPKQASKGMVVTSHFLATESGLQILKEGGNAIDAAVTAAFVLAVSQPRSGNIGGGGFMLISSEESGDVVAIDYREKAPKKADRDMFLTASGAVDTQRSRFTHLAAGVPGTVAGLSMALEKYGTISLPQALAPAIALAESGFLVTTRLRRGIQQKEDLLQSFHSTKKIFFKDDGTAYQIGERFIQKDLAKTLRRIAQSGGRDFYEGETAELIVKEMERHNGLISREDLKNYRAVLRKPVHGHYRGYDVYSMPPPSSGGIHIIQLLNILEHYPLSQYGHNSAKTIHIMSEAMKLAYADRSRHLGDEDFVRVPRSGLISKKYGAALRKHINQEQATSSITIHPGNPSLYESDETTHFSITDRFGNSVSNTYTLNFSFGSGIVVAGAGFLLNNQMDDFSAKPGFPNAYGLIGGAANEIAGEKRMLSSMSPTIVKHSGKNVLVTGSPGGSRIITTTLQVILNVIDHRMNIQNAVNAPRVHHQWLPDELRIEEGISPDTISLLQQMGHRVVQKKAMGAIQTIAIRDGIMYGAADPRRSTSRAEGF